VDPNLTKDGTVFGMAHFAGTGPYGKTCGDCKFLTFIKGNHARCEQFRRLMGKYGPADIPYRTHACKYFVEAKRNAKK
jgi:hypothetical protein